MNEFDLIVLGAGPGGYISALYAAQNGMKVCLIEKDRVGGTCLHRGCIPTKVMLHSAALLSSLSDMKNAGITVDAYRFDPARLFAARDAIVERLHGGILSLLRARKVTLVQGAGTFTSSRSVRVGNDDYTAPFLLIATGSAPASLSRIPYDQKRIFSSEGILALKTIPSRLLVIGGGVIGCEFAQFYRAAGSEVSIVEMASGLLPSYDPELGRRLELSFKKRKIDVAVGTTVDRVERSSDQVVAFLSNGVSVPADAILVSIGRTLNSDGIGIETTGIVPERGKIPVDQYMRSAVKGIYAVGDITGGPMLAHAASYEGIVACDHMLGRERKADYEAIPSCVYTIPEIATCGMHERDAMARYPEARVSRFPYTASGKAQIIGKTDGFMKLIQSPDGTILGGAIMGEGACDLIGEISLAIAAKMKAGDLAKAVHGHPTLSEIIGETVMAGLKTPLHTI